VYLAQLHIHSAQYAEALAICHVIEHRGATLAGHVYGQVLYMRALVSIASQKYVLAHQQLNESYAKYQQYFSIEKYLWNVSIMKALCFVCEGQLSEAFVQLQQLVRKLAYLDHQQIVHVAECTALYLMKTEQTLFARQLMQVIVRNVPMHPHVYVLLGVAQYKEYVMMMHQLYSDVGEAIVCEEVDLWQQLMFHIKHSLHQHASLVS
jgi:hypothetical protein